MEDRHILRNRLLPIPEYETRLCVTYGIESEGIQCEQTGNTKDSQAVVDRKGARGSRKVAVLGEIRLQICPLPRMNPRIAGCDHQEE